MAAKIARKQQKIFGSTAPVAQMGVFGSYAAGAPATSLDPNTIQSLTKYGLGWYGAVLAGNSPAIEDMNALFYLLSWNIAYNQQMGVAEWSATTEYFIGSLATDGLGNMYQSIIDNNLNQALTDTTKWKIFSLKTVSQFSATIGAGADCTHATLAAALADSNLGTNIRVLIRDSAALAGAVTLTKAGWRIEAQPGVTYSKSGGTGAIIIDAANIWITGLRFSAYSTAGDKAIAYTANGTYGRILHCNFANCATDVDDTLAPAGYKPVVMGNITE